MSRKLIRDFVPVSHGSVQEVSDAEVIPFLRRKLLEEMGEYFGEHDAAELLDARDVLERLIALEVTAAISRAHGRKFTGRGMFERNRVWSYGEHA